MKISLFQGVLLGIFGLGAVIGLVVFATYTSSGGSSSQIGDVTVWGTLPKDGIDAALTEITKTDASLKGITYVQKDPASIQSDLTSAIAVGNPPDLVLISQEQVLPLAKFLTPIPLSTLSARTFTSAFTNEAQLFTAPNGSGYYGVPYLVDPLVLFTNRTILASDGIAKPPATWEALTGLVPSVAQLSSSQKIIRGLIALGTYANVHNAGAILSALFQQTGVPITTVSSNGVRSADLGISGTGGVPPGQAVLRFYTQFADSSKVSYTWNPSLPDSQSAFLAGDLALYLGFASEARFLRQANPNLDFDMAPLPQPATATLKSTYGRVYAFAVPRGAANSAGGYQAAVLLSNAAEQAASAVATGLAPASLTVLGQAPSDPFAAVAYKSALYARGWLSPSPADTDRVFSGMISDVNSGRLTLDSALAYAERTLGALLQQ